jgi:catechol 2,3-dioxygenase-like lactoylglutathione lyase family enzyme
MSSGIAQAAITVNDTNKALDFYTRATDLKKVFELTEPKTGKPWIVYLT